MPEDSIRNEAGLDEEPLSGGNIRSGVVRVGNTVRRPIGSWTPAVHGLLKHLESAGFEGAPRLLGIDEKGREILEYIPGEIPWPARHYQLLGTDEAMRRAGGLLREFHDAVGSFVPPPDAAWQDPERAKDADPWVDERGTIICHNDATAWNLVIGEHRWALIDWDGAGPRPFLWDLAYAVIGLIPISPDLSSHGWPGPPPVVPRLLAFADGYGLEQADRERLIRALLARIEDSLNHLRRKAQAGVEPWATLWKEGHGDGWAGLLSYAQQNSERWHNEISAYA